MKIETYPITVNVGKQWKKIENSAPQSNPEKELAFFYIGSGDESLQAYAGFFSAGIFASDFTEAQLLIEKSRLEDVPDAIFINLPLNQANLIHFISFLKEKGFAAHTSIIYNEKQLDPAKIRLLRQHGLVDDVVDINSEDVDFAAKIKFLEKLKVRSNALVVSKEGRIEDVTAQKGQPIMKRGIDILLSSIAILLCLPVFALVAAIIKMTSRGPVFYISERAGRGFRVFKFYKFRTMEVNADKKIHELAHLNQYGTTPGAAQFMKISNDPRVTRFGAFLRKTSLDELPQLLNVLLGDMSLVGNRPLPLYEALTLTTDDSVERFAAPAGITGLWQIKKRGKDDMSSEERISLDISYARKANLAYDLWIMAKTPTVLFQKSNV